MKFFPTTFPEGQYRGSEVQVRRNESSYLPRVKESFVNEGIKTDKRDFLNFLCSYVFATKIIRLVPSKRSVNSKRIRGRELLILTDLIPMFCDSGV